MSDRSGNGGGPERMTPPYAAYVAFDAFIRRAAQEPIPTQVDKALLVEWGIAAANESALLTSLKGLGLIEEAGHPTELYQQIRLSAPRRRAALQQCLGRAFPGLNSTTDEPISQNDLHDYFVADRGLTGQMVSKAIRFYRQLTDAIETTSTEGDRPRSVPAPKRPPTQVTRQTVGELGQADEVMPPTGTRARRHRPRPLSAVRHQPRIPTAPADAILSVAVQISSDLDEEQLVELFGKIRRAWSRAAESG